MARADRGVPRAPAGHRRDAGRHPARGRHAAAPRATGSPTSSDLDVWLKIEGANPTGSFKDRGMTMAITKAVEDGREGRRLRVDREHLGVGRGVRRARRAHLWRRDPAGSDRAGQARAGAHPRRAGGAGAGQLRRGARRRPRARPPRRGHGRELDQPVPDRGPEDRGVRDRRRARRRARRALHPGRQRRQHHRVLAGLPRVRSGSAARTARPRMLGWQAQGAAPLVPGRAGPASRRRSPPRSASGTRRAGTARSPHATSPAARSARSATRRS